MARNKRRKDNSESNEITGVLLIIISLFFLICLWTSMLGDIGLAVKNVCTGLLGYFAYAVFVIMLLLGAFTLLKARVVVPKKLVAFIVFACIFFLLILQLATSTKYLGLSFGEYISKVYDHTQAKTIGGILFGVFAYATKTVATTIGAYVLFSILLAFFLGLLAFGIINSRKTLPANKRNYNKNKKTKSSFIRGAGQKAAPIKTVSVGGLYIGNIIPKEKRAVNEVGSFSDISSPKKQPQPAAKKLSDYFSSLKGEEQPQKERLNAKQILFDDASKMSRQSTARFLSKSNQLKELDRDSLGPSMPSQIETRPDIKDDAVKLKKAERKTPEVVFLPQKDSEPTYYEGEIINAEEFSSKMENHTYEDNPPPTTRDNFVDTQYDFSNEEQRTNEFLNREDKTLISQPDIQQQDEPDIINCEEIAENIVQNDINQVFTKHNDFDKDCYELPSEDTFEDSRLDSIYSDLQQETQINEPEEETTELEEPTQNDYLDGEDYTKSEKFVTPIKEAVFDYSDLEEEIEFEEEQFQESQEDLEGQDIDEDSDNEPKESNLQSNNEDYTGYYERQPNKAKFSDRASLLDKQIDPKNQINIEKYLQDTAAETPIKPRKKRNTRYMPPPLELLTSVSTNLDDYGDDLQNNAMVLEETLKNLKLPAKVIGITRGPAVTRYELEMPPGYTVKKIEGFSQDIAYALASTGGIRIEAPIPGKRAVGVEVPNNTIGIVSLREMIESVEFNKSSSHLSLCIGKDIAGKPIICNLEKMPHLLVAGSTGSGKSACLHSIIVSMLYKSSPDDVRLILIDPKRVEFPFYRGLRHLMINTIINEREHAINAFKWVREEMEERYKLLAKYGSRNLQEYNASSAVKSGEAEKLPSIVIIVDELSDLMQGGYKKEMEEHILSIAQKARASGVHLILATQRPSVDVITGTIKINLPSRIALAVSNGMDSKTILDQGGAEMLLGRGDLLYAPIDAPDPKRIQGAYVTKEEVEQIVEYINRHNSEDFYDEAEEKIMQIKDNQSEQEQNTEEEEEYDQILEDVARKVIETNQASTSMMQRRFKLGYARASRIIDQMESLNFIGPMDINRPTKPREVYITKETFKEFFGKDY